MTPRATRDLRDRLLHALREARPDIQFDSGEAESDGESYYVILWSMPQWVWDTQRKRWRSRAKPSWLHGIRIHPDGQMIQYSREFQARPRQPTGRERPDRFIQRTFTDVDALLDRVAVILADGNPEDSTP
jgi:hypothetical protein